MASEPDTSFDGRGLLILYATETGNAQDAADYISRQCRRISFKCRVLSVDEFPLEELVCEELVIFVVSTTGSGIEPRSMTPLWTNLCRSELTSDIFEDLTYAVFGLGDTAYEKFCWAAKKLARRLETLGAHELCPRGEGDEQHPLGIDGALQSWTESLLESLVEEYPLPPNTEVQTGTRLPPSRVKFEPTTGQQLQHAVDPFVEDLHSHKATVMENKRITADDWYQDVRHFEFEFDEPVDYEPGDVAVIHPIALSSDVESFLDEVGWIEQADEPLKIQHVMLGDQSLPGHLPSVTTLRQLFTLYLDFDAVPRRSFFQFIRHFTTSELEQEKLDEFLSKEGADELYEYCYRVRRTIREILSEFRATKVPKDYVFDVFPTLRPREFSIACSAKKHPRKLQLCVAIVKYRTKLKIPRKGVCTSYLSKLLTGDKISIGIKKGFIELPDDASTPIICVGPGTGVAPMRAVIEERIEEGAPNNTLYFGCRSGSKDQHYGDEWESYAKQQSITYRAAFSRDGPEGQKRTYVQDLILEDSERIYRLIFEEGAWVYISGSSNKMPAAVKEALAHAIETCGGYSSEQASKYIRMMANTGRLREECWS
ncbi:hypothetical protein BJ165DRAFT_1531064 [Panaeolus papilionaceus]|nr:hypothetical protein BJ165DRAFT_1531064 [Panaeolus papilionaceus]